MSDHHDKHPPHTRLTPKQKHKAQVVRNKRHQNVFRMVQEVLKGQARMREEQAHAVSSTSSGPDEAVGDKVAMIRNRLNGKKRVSRERWNRFAGTSDGGGRGL